MLLEQGVVKNGVRVVEAPICNANEDIFTRVALRETYASVYGVGVEVFDCFV